MEIDSSSLPGSGGLSKRPAVVSQDLINLILAGRTKKVSIEVPSNVEPADNGRRLQSFMIDSESTYTHLLGEVNGSKYDIRGRPELDYLFINYKQPVGVASNRLNAVHVHERYLTEVTTTSAIPMLINEHDLIPPLLFSKILSTDIHLLLEPTKEMFILSPKMEDLLMLKVNFCPSGNELVVTKCTSSFGSYEFNTISNVKQKLFRRFVRSCIQPLLLNRDRYELMEERIYHMTSSRTTLYLEDDVNDETLSDTTSQSTADDENRRKPTGKYSRLNELDATKPTSAPTVTAVKSKKTGSKKLTSTNANAHSSNNVSSKKELSRQAFPGTDNRPTTGAPQSRQATPALSRTVTPADSKRTK
jgi:hypothetical protein